jgi:hypothetical protein
MSLHDFDRTIEITPTASGLSVLRNGNRWICRRRFTDKEQGMRIRVTQRVLLLGIVLALLCALPAVTPSSSFAKPFNWDRDADDPENPGPAGGDGDGTVVKARWIGGTTYDATREATVSVTSQRPRSIWRTYLSLVRWGFGTRWIAY